MQTMYAVLEDLGYAVDVETSHGLREDVTHVVRIKTRSQLRSAIVSSDALWRDKRTYQSATEHTAAVFGEAVYVMALPLSS